MVLNIDNLQNIKSKKNENWYNKDQVDIVK